MEWLYLGSIFDGNESELIKLAKDAGYDRHKKVCNHATMCKMAHFARNVVSSDDLKVVQSCMTSTEKIVVAKISAKVKHSGKVIQFIY